MTKQKGAEVKQSEYCTSGKILAKEKTTNQTDVKIGIMGVKKAFVIRDN